jgi:5'(3')-deoxyribonucleotidase
MKRILIDCDGVLIDSGKLWLRYLMNHYQLKEGFFGCLPTPLPYNLTELFIFADEDNERYLGDGFEYWNNFQLYDNITPRADAISVIPKLKELGYEVVFCSRVIGNHGMSKEKFLNKWFPNNDGIVFTKDKHLVKCDVFIDDSVVNLNNMYHNNPEVDCYKFRLDYKEPEDPIRDFKVVYNWYTIYDILKEKL